MPQDGTLWAIAAYFNPVGYRRRLENYRRFRRSLNVPLAAVELAYGKSFELRADDADVLLQLRCRDVMWQKERLLNLALQSLPDECRYVAVLDCDVIMDSDDWGTRACELLEDYPVVQPFVRACDLDRDAADHSEPFSRVVLTTPAVAVQLAQGVPYQRMVHARGAPRPAIEGMASVVRRELLDAHGFYDACIVGGGTRAMMSAAYGCFDDVPVNWRMNARQTEHYLAWARRYYAAVRGRIGYINGTIYHMWHGELPNRWSRRRHFGLTEFAFDPYSDIAIDESGAWRWSSEKLPMHRYVREYFESRREDG